MENKHRLMIVDDAPDQIQTLLHLLKDDYLITAATSADAAIKKLLDHAEQDLEQLPDVVLMDVNMPGTNGYEACNIIKKDSTLERIDVIFLSSNNSTEEILAGLDAGACDYVVKPYNPEVLLSKIKRTIQLHDQREQLRENASSASAMVQTVMTVTGSLSILLHFLRSSLAANDLRELCESCLQSLQEFGCDGVVYCQLGKQRECLSSNDLPSMLELELLERIHGGSDPFIERAGSLFVLGRQMTLLIKSPPDEPNQLGSLKDNLKILLEGADAKIDALQLASSQSGEKCGQLGEQLSAATNVLEEIRGRQRQHKDSSINVVEQLSIDLENSFYDMNLTENQEEQLSKIISVNSQQCVDHLELASEMDEDMDKLISELRLLAQQLGK